jgi:hypothetical protein
MIGQRLFRWVAPIVVILGLWLPASPAQSSDAPGADQAERNPPALQYALAGLFTLLVLVIVCMPSRKA